MATLSVKRNLARDFVGAADIGLSLETFEAVLENAPMVVSGYERGRLQRSG